jgi:hypothetical protein
MDLGCRERYLLCPLENVAETDENIQDCMIDFNIAEIKVVFPYGGRF